MTVTRSERRMQTTDFVEGTFEGKYLLDFGQSGWMYPEKYQYTIMVTLKDGGEPKLTKSLVVEAKNKYGIASRGNWSSAYLPTVPSYEYGHGAAGWFKDLPVALVEELDRAMSSLYT